MDRLALLLLLATLLVAAPTAADPATGRPLAVGERMPALAGHDLTGHHAALPEAARGRVALVMLASPTSPATSSRRGPSAGAPASAPTVPSRCSRCR
jgi:hypothetical protein